MTSMALGSHIQRSGCLNQRRAAPPFQGNGPCLPPCHRPATIHARRYQTVASASRGMGRGGPQDDMGFHETKLGPNVIASVKDLRAGGIKWGTATVVRNDSQSLDGSVRVLHLSVADHVDMLYGMRVKGVPDAPRWIESYTIPGQCVGLRLPTGQQQQQQQDTPSASSAPSSPSSSPPRRLYSIASSPYASRRDSAYVDACLIEVVVERCGDAEEAALADLGPGAQLEVTPVIGRGFCSLLDSYNGVTHALEEGRNLVLIGMGTRGMAALRSALNWQPVLAHAASPGRAVTVMFLAHSPGRAAFVPEWDSWRDAGMRLRPLYTHPSAGVDEQAIVGNGAASAPAPAAAAAAGGAAGEPDLDPVRCMDLLQLALFMQEGGFEGVCGGPTSRCAFLLAGLPGDMASVVARQLSAKGVAYEHILFAQSDFF